MLSPDPAPPAGSAPAPSSAWEPPPVAAPPTSGGSRVLVGCAFGCAGLALLGLLALVAAVLWILVPPDQVPSDALAGPSTLAVVRLEDLAGDPGATLSLAALEEAARAAAEEPGRRGGAPPFGKLAMFLPREGTLIVEPGVSTPERKDARGRLCLALNLRSFVRPLRMGLLSLDTRGGWTRLERHGFPVRVQEREHVALAIAGGTLLVADDLGVLEEALARAASWQAGDREAPALPEGFPQEQEDWDARVWARGAPGELATALGPWLARVLGPATGEELDGADLAGVLGLAGGADLVDAERLRWRVRFDLVDALAAERLLLRLEGALERAARRSSERGRLLEWRAFASDRRVTVEGEESGLSSLWRDLAPR